MDNLLSKLTRLHIEERSFLPDGESERRTYYVAVLSVGLNGNPRTVDLKINKDKAQILEVADTVNNTL